MGCLIGTSAALLPLTLVAVVGQQLEWLERFWLVVLVATGTSAASFSLAEALMRRVRTKRRLVPLVVLGAATVAFVIVVLAWAEGLARGDEPWQAVSEGLWILASHARKPGRTLAFMASGALPFVLGGLGRARSPRGWQRCGESVLATAVGGALGVGLLTQALPVDLFPVAYLFLVMPCAVVGGMSAVDWVEPRLVASLARLGPD